MAISADGFAEENFPLHKGDLARPWRTQTGWRRATHEERALWYAKLYADCHAGNDTPCDDGGESKLAPNDTYFTLLPSMTLTVLRGRVAAPCGYAKIKRCVEVFCPDNGETLFVERRALISSW